MADVLIAALITATAAVILAPLVTRLLAYFAERTANLKVAIELHKFAVYRSYLTWHIALAKNADWNEPSVVRLRDLSMFDSLVVISITNPGTKLVKNVTVTPKNSCVYAVGDSDELGDANKDKPIVVGDVQPRRSRELKIWARVGWVRHLTTLREAFQISADELHRVHITYPVSSYQAGRFTFLPKWVETAWLVLVWTSLIVGIPLAIIWVGIVLYQKFFG